MLFQAGTAELKPPLLPSAADSSAYVVGLVRQLSFTDPEGDYLGMEQLRLDVIFPPSPMLAALPEPAVWGVAGLRESSGASADEEGIYRAVPAWRDAVESTEAFHALASSSAPMRAILSP